MSSGFDIFIKTEKSFEDVKSCLEMILNCRMEKSAYVEYELYYAIVLGMGIGLHKEHTFEEDNGISFSSYEFSINLDYIKPAYLRDYRHEWEISVGVVIADMLSLNLHCETLVVKDIYEVIDRFTPGEQIHMPYNKLK